MKSSIYNIYKRGKNGYLLINTLTIAEVHIDEETKRLLEENPDEIPEDILGILLENGFVVEDNCDEKKIFAYLFDRDKYNVFPRDLVYTVVMTYACNLECPYCYLGPEKSNEILNTERVEVLLKNIEKNLNKKNFKALGISLTGGEPLLAYQQCLQLMEGAFRICNQQNKEFKGNIVTNGVFINEEVVDTLLNPYCEKIQVTFDGGRKAHNKRRIRKDGSGTYDTLLDVLELLKDANIDLTLKLNLDRENIETFIELSKDLKERGLDNIKKSLGRIYPINIERLNDRRANYAEKCIYPEEMEDFADKIYEQMGETGFQHVPLEISRHSPCTFDREDIFVVDPYLDLYNCTEFLGLKDKKVGNINKNGEMIFNYEYYEQMSRNPLEFEECRVCKYLPLCAGGCAARAYLKNGTYHSSFCGKSGYSFQKSIEKNINRMLEEIELSISDSEI